MLHLRMHSPKLRAMHTTPSHPPSRVHLHTLTAFPTPLRLILKRRLQPPGNILPLIQREVLLHAPNTQTRIIHRQLLILTQTVLQRPKRMLNQLLPTATLKRVEVPLQVRARHLTPRPDPARHHLLRHPTRLELEEVRAAGVDPGDQQTDAIGPLAVVLGVGLSAVANAGGDFGEQDGAVVGQARGE